MGGWISRRDQSMQQADQTQSVGLFIQVSGGEEVGVKLTLDGFKDVALCLSVRQARAFASDLIQHAHRIEVKNSLKKHNSKQLSSLRDELVPQ